MHTQVLKIEKRIHADPARLFRAWLKADDFSRWFLSGNDTTPIGIESVFIDPRPGGRFKINMTLDGKVFPHEGEYLVIEEPTKLVFTWRSHATGHLNTLVTVTFQALPDVVDTHSGKKPQTLLTLIHERLANRTEVEMHQQGWTNILAGLEKWQGEET